MNYVLVYFIKYVYNTIDPKEKKSDCIFDVQEESLCAKYSKIWTVKYVVL